MLRSRIESVGVSPPRNGPLKRGSLAHAAQAGSKCLASSRYLPIDVEMMINAGVHRDQHYAEPAFACYIQNKLAINVEFQRRQTASFDLQNGDSGMLNAMHVLAVMIETGSIRTGLAIASEVNTDRDPDPGSGINASGAAVMMEASALSGRGFSTFHFETFDAYRDMRRSWVDLRVPKGRLMTRSDDDFDLTSLELLPGVWKELLEREGTGPDGIDLVIPSQLSARFLEGLPGALGVPPDTIVDVHALYGDTRTTSPILALERALRDGRAKPGTRAAIVTVGSGITIGGAIHHF